MMVENEIDIDAPAPVVWRVTADVEQWPTWTPTVTTVKRLDDGPFDVGSKAMIKQPGMPETEWQVSTLTKCEGLAWQTRVRGMTIVATHVLEATNAGTRSTLRVEMSGFVALLLWPFVRRSVRNALAKENAGLKQASEAAAA